MQGKSLDRSAVLADWSRAFRQHRKWNQNVPNWSAICVVWSKVDWSGSLNRAAICVNRSDNKKKLAKDLENP